jgi:hypothetical protein
MCVHLPTKNLNLVVHLADFPPVSTTDIRAKDFVSCLINGRDFTVQLFLIRPFRSCRKRITNDFNWTDLFCIEIVERTD